MRKQVDLTILPGWSSLSSGSHSITIVAKADGYADSEPSEAVSVTKQSIVAYKATITGLGNSSPTSQTYAVDSGFPTRFEEVTKDGDIFIKIPTMYRKVNTVSSGQITSFTISTAKEDDSYFPYPCFVRPDGSVMDYILIGKYLISSSSTANSVNTTKVNLTPAQGIALCKNKGAGYYPYDVWTQKLFQDLELAIGKKVNYNSGTTITVSKIGLNHIDQDHWVLGVIGSSGSWYACYDPDKYQALEATDSPIPQDYVGIGYAQPTKTGDEIQKLGYDESNPFFNYPTATVANAKYNTYYCDKTLNNSGNLPISSMVGHDFAYYGLWCVFALSKWSGKLGVRLCYRPL